MGGTAGLCEIHLTINSNVLLPSPQTWAILTQTPLPHPIPILPPPHLPQKINIIHEKLIIIKKKGRKTNKRHAI